MAFLCRLNLSKQNKQVVELYISTFVGTLLGVVSSIINTRFLDPVNYGDVRYVQNIINLIAALLLFGYFLSGSRLLALSNDEAYSRRIRGAMVVILLIASLILIIGTASNYWIHLYNGKLTVAPLFIISLHVCIHQLLLNYVNTTAQGDNHIGRLSVARMLPALLYIPLAYWIYTQFGATSTRMILLQWGTSSLILIGVIVSTKPSFHRLAYVFRELNQENKQYGLQLYYGQLAMVATNYIAGVALGIFNVDNANVCYFTLALTITSPLILVPSIIGTTYFKTFATQDRISKKVMRGTIVVTVVSCIGYIAIIKPVVSLLYPAAYAVVGIYATILAVGCSIHGLGDMINRYLGSHGQGIAIRNSSFACGLLKVGGYIGLVYLWNIEGALITNILSSLIYSGILFCYYYRFTKGSRVNNRY